MAFDAFVSYSHAADAKLAAELQTALHRLARPWYAVRALHVFRDKTSLSANPALWPAIETALADSSFFLLLASTSSAHSAWVEKETTWWLEHRSPESLFIIVTDGAVVWDSLASDFDWNQTNSLPKNLQGKYKQEPLYVDLRWARAEPELSLRQSGFRSAVLDIAAPLHRKPKDEIDGEDIRQHRRVKRLSWTAGVLLFCLTVAAVFSAFQAIRNAREAVKEQKEAEGQRTQAEKRKTEAETQTGRALFAQGDALFRASRYEAARETYAEARNWLGRTQQSTLAVDAAIAYEERVAIPPIAILGRHTSEGPVAAITPNGRWALLAGYDGVLRRADRDAGYRFQEIGKHADWITAIAVAANSRMALTAGRDGTVKLWDLDQGKQTSTLKAGSPVWSVAFSPDGKTALSGGDDRQIRVWDLKRGALKTVLAEGDHPHRGWISALGFSADGEIAFSGSRDGAIKIWNVRDWSFRCSFGAMERLESAAIAASGTRLVSVDEQGNIRVWDTQSGVELKKIVPTTADLARVILLLPEYRLGIIGGAFGGAGLAFVGGKSGSLALWDLVKGERLQELEGHGRSVQTLSLSERDETVLSASDDGTIRLWPARPLPPQISVDALSLNASDVSPGDSRIVASGGGEGQVLIWDADLMRPLKKLWPRGAAVSAISFFPDGESLVVARRDGTVSSGSVIANEPDHVIRLGDSPAMLRACPDPGSFVVLQENGTVTRFANGGAIRSPLPTGIRKADIHAVSSDCRYMTIGRVGDPVTVWDLSSGKRIATIGVAPAGFLTAALIDGSGLLLGTSDRTVEFWRFNPPQKTWASAQLPFQPTALAVSPSGPMSLVGDVNGNVHLVDLRTGEVFRSYPGHDGATLVVSVDRSGARGISGGLDGAARVWSITEAAQAAGQRKGPIEDLAGAMSGSSRRDTAALLARRGAYPLALNLFGDPRQTHVPQTEFALTLWMTGHLNEAREEFEMLAKGDRSALHTRLALDALKQDMADAARRSQDSAVYQAYRAMGSLATPSVAEELAYVDAGVRALGWTADPYLDRARLREQNGDLAGAVSDYTAALQLHPTGSNELAAVYAARALALQEMHEDERAIRDYGRAIELNPGDPANFNNIGNMLFARGDYDRALDLYSRAIAVAPQEPRPLIARGVARLRSGDPAGALTDLAEARTLARTAQDTGSMARAVHGTALAQLTLGKIEPAREAFDESIRLSGSPESMVGRAVLHLVTREWKSALADFQGACSRNQRYCVPLALLALAQVDREAATMQISRLSQTSYKEDADALTMALTGAPARRREHSCVQDFYMGAVAIINGGLDAGRPYLEGATRTCERSGWYYLAASGMLRQRQAVPHE